MEISIVQFDGEQFSTTANMDKNINLHGTMFAGSIYTLATLTGWGMVYLQLKKMGLSGDIVLADANIKYLKPLTHEPLAKVCMDNANNQLARLEVNRNGKMHLIVSLFSNNEKVAEFSGQYVVIKPQTESVSDTE